MSLYEILINSPAEFISEGMPDKVVENEALKTKVGAVFLRMGKFKFNFASHVFEPIFPGNVYRLASDQEEIHYVGYPEMTAREKAWESTTDILQAATIRDQTLLPGRLVLSIGQDNQICLEDGRVVNKPRDTASKAEIFETMTAILCTHEPITIRLKMGFAVYGREFGSSVADGRGATIRRERKFTVSPFTREELWAYLNELPVEELRQTNGGFRWPHPIFLDHITSIDRIDKTSPDFDRKRYGLIQSLIGADWRFLAYLAEYTNRINQPNQPIEFLDLPMGKVAEVRQVNYSDRLELTAISDLLCTNFANHPSYASLETSVRAEFMRVNSPEGIFQTSGHPQNLMAAVVLVDEQIAGYCVLRREGETRAELRRMHVGIAFESNGIASYLLDKAEMTAYFSGCKEVAVLSSGNSDSFFQNRGYNGNGREKNQKLADRGIDTHVNYCTKHLR